MIEIKFYPRDQLVIRDRQRSQIERGPLEELADSIAKPAGLIHAPTARWVQNPEDKDDWVLLLITGERRVRAMDLLHAAGRPFTYGGNYIPYGNVPVLILDLEEADAVEAELEENLRRQELPWADRVKALARLHALRKTEDPTQTIRDTAREVVAATVSNPAPTTVFTTAGEITRAVTVAAHLDDPEIAGARNVAEAHRKVVKRQIEAVEAERNKRRSEAVAKVPELVELVNANSFDYIQTLPAATYDLILADPPYGINVNVGGFRQRTEQHHNYDDTAETALAAAELLFLEGWRVTKNRANLFMFLDVRNFNTFRDLGSRCGWDVWPFPIIWIKGNEGLLPGFGGGRGFRHCYEAILYATKGKRGLNNHPVDAIFEKRVSRAERIYAAQKPLALVSALIEASTNINDAVLDPFSGAGTTMRAARLLRRRGLGIELQPSVHATACAYVFAGESQLDEVAAQFGEEETSGAASSAGDAV